MAAEQATLLTSLLTSTTALILDEYKAKGLVLPSLESEATGPFDLPENSSFDFVRNLRIVEAACGQLCALLMPPGHSIMNKSFGHVESAAMRIIINNKISDILSGQPKGMHVRDIAEKSGLDQGKLYRILRLLATKHVFTEVKPKVFANNRLSVKLGSTQPVAGYVGHQTDECHKGFAYLDEVVSDPLIGKSLLTNDSGLAKAMGMPAFELFDKYEKYGHRFNQAMLGWGEVTGRSMLAKVYPWDTVDGDITVVDVGGGNGHVMMALLKAYPKVKAVIQDTPKVIEVGVKNWEKDYPTALELKRAQFIGINFFEASPVPYGDVYYLRHVLHDWPNAQAQTILTNVRNAMKPGKKLLIHELAPQPVARVPDALYEQAPEPLLSNYGVGKVRVYNMDLMMMMAMNAMERTLEDFRELAEPLGFKFEKFYDAGEVSLIEFVAV